jgi:serine/threonine protein kinase
MSESPDDLLGARRNAGQPEETFDAKLEAERLLDQFEECWRCGETPDLSRFLALGEHLGAQYSNELHRVEFEYRAGALKDINREILFGLLAAQLQFVPRGAIVEAVRDWLQDRRESVGGILVRRGSLQGEQRQLLEALTNEQIKKNWGDIVQSIADLSSVTQLLAELQAIQASELKQSLDTITIVRDSLRGKKTERKASGAGSRFRIIKFEAKGGLGQVYLARDEELGREVALKEIQPDKADDDDNRSRFVVEAEITGGLEHPGIVPVYGLGFYGDGRPYYAMRFIRGNNLTSAIERFHDPGRAITVEERTMEFRQLLGRFVDVCQAIGYAHSRGVLHRDLKPGNIMLGKYGETLVVDWGLAKIAGRQDKSAPVGAAETTLKPASASGSAPTVLGAAIGTPQYMSPEQAMGKLHELGPATDVYSLGATFYHLLTGSPPYGKQSSVEAILELARGGKWAPALKVKPKLPPALAAICEKAMALHPADRYGSVGLLAQDVEKWLADEPVSAYPEPLVARTRRWVKRHQTVVGIGASVVLVMLIGAILFAINQAKQRKEVEGLNSNLTKVNTALDLSVKEKESARREADIRRQCAELQRDFDLALARRGDPNEASLRNLNDLLKKVKSISEEGVIEKDLYDRKREELVSAFKADMNQLANAPHFTEDRKQQFEQLTEIFETFELPGSESILMELGVLKTNRFAAQNRVIDNDRDAVSMTGAGAEPVFFKNIVLDGDFEARCEFLPSWVNSKFVGMVLADATISTTLQYRFLILGPQLKETALDETFVSQADPIDRSLRSASARPLKMVIMRGPLTLASKNVSLSGGPLILMVTRDRGLITLAANPSDPKADELRIRCDDPFAPPRLTAGIGAYSAEGSKVSLTQLLTTRLPETLSPIEQGDELFKKNQMADARLKYQSEADSLEAKYKLALTYLATGNEPQAKEILTEVVFGGDPGDEASRWRRFAQIKLLTVLANDEPTPWVEIRRIVDRLRDGDAAELLRATPKAERDVILQELGKVGLRFRLAFETSDDLKELKLRRELGELFEEDSAARVSTAWRTADVYRFAGDQKNAEIELRRALDLVQDDDRTQRLLIEDLSWLLTAELGSTRDSNGQWFLDHSKAVDVIEWLGKFIKNPQDGQNRRYFPLLAERARVHYLMGQKAEARADLTQLFDLIKTQPDAIAFSEYAQALHVSAFLYEDEGKAFEARNERNRIGSAIGVGGSVQELSPDASSAESIDATLGLAFKGLAVSFNGEAEWQEVLSLTKGHLPGSGLSGSITRTVLALVTESTKARYGKLRAQEFLHRFVTTLYQFPRGKQMGREMALKACSLSDFQRRPMPLMLYEAVRLSSFGGGEIPAEIELIAWDRCQQIVECYNHQLITEDELDEILFLWSGGYTPTRWSTLKQKLEQEAEHFPAPRGLTESIAYVLARNYLASDIVENHRYARELLEFAAKSEYSPPPISAAAQVELSNLNANPPSNK